MDVVPIAASRAPHPLIYISFAYTQQEKQHPLAGRPAEVRSITSVLHLSFGEYPTGPA
jgi:hypothetical protein